MTSCLAETHLGLAFDPFVVGQLFTGVSLLGQTSWVPTWLTPLWLIAVGLGLGAIGAIVVYGALALLSCIPGLGTLADSPGRGITASLLVGGVASAALCYRFIEPSEGYFESRYLPTICIGLLLGFGLIYGMWQRTRVEWTQIVREGVVPYLLGVAALFGVIGLAATPMIAEPMAFIRAIPEVNLLDDGIVRLPISIPGIPPGVDPDQAPFVPAEVDYDMLSASEVKI